MIICAVLSFVSLYSKAMAAARKRTFIMVKPDGVQTELVGKIIKRFETKGFKLSPGYVNSIHVKKECIVRFVIAFCTLTLIGVNII